MRKRLEHSFLLAGREMDCNELSTVHEFSVLSMFWFVYFPLLRLRFVIGIRHLNRRFGNVRVTIS
jgi:hypothetical protein